MDTNKEKSKRRNKTEGHKVIDLTSFINPKMIHSDPNGSYTGTTSDTFYKNDYDDPVQDADDL